MTLNSDEPEWKGDLYGDVHGGKLWETCCYPDHPWGAPSLIGPSRGSINLSLRLDGFSYVEFIITLQRNRRVKYYQNNDGLFLSLLEFAIYILHESEIGICGGVSFFDFLSHESSVVFALWRCQTPISYGLGVI